MKYRCAYCGKEQEAVQLRTIESAFQAPDDTGAMGAWNDTQTVCAEPCADIFRNASFSILRDEVFNP